MVVISNCNVKSVLKIGLFGLIALFVLSVSVPSAFAQTDSESESPLRMVLDITYQNIVESITDSGMDQDEIDLRLLQVDEEYNEAIDLINGDDIVAAKQDVVQTMGIFELIAEDIAESNPIPSQLTPGFGSGIDSASDTGITQGQGLGVGGVPPGIFNQISAANTFAVSEAITSIDEEVGQYRELAKLNNLEGIDFGEFDKSVNLAKTLLANGVVPDAQVKLELANQIKDDLLQKIQDAANENSAADIEQYMDEQKNLGLTQKDIRELENILEDITTEDNEKTGDGNIPADNEDETPGNSGDAPGQNKDDSGDETPGNSGDVPGQNKDKDNDKTDLPSGFEAAGDNPSENGFANGNGLGIGKIPPGLAKKMFGMDDGLETGLPPGFEAAGDNPSENGFANGNGLEIGNIPPGQFKKLDYSEFGEYSPDDYFDDATEDLREDSFEAKFDKMNKDSKAKEKKDEIKQAKLDKIAAAAANGGSPGLAKKVNDGITDTIGNQCAVIGTTYDVTGFTAIKNGKTVDPDGIKIDVGSPGAGSNIHNNKKQNGSPSSDFTINGPAGTTYVITATVSQDTLTRTVTAQTSCGGGNSPTVTNTIPDISINENAPTNTLNLGLVFDDTEDADNAMTYTITANDNTTLVPTGSAISGTTLTLDYANSGSGTANITIQAEDTNGNKVTDTFVITVTAGICTNDPPTIGTKASGGSNKDWDSVGDCTIIGNNYAIGVKWNVLDHVRIGNNFSGGNGSNGATDIFAGAIIGDNVNAGTSTVAAGVIIPNGITL